MKRVMIVQARMTSTRLPGKILKDLAGKPMLAQQIRRLKRCQRVDEWVIATTVNTIDDPVVEIARKENIRCFRGSELDVLSRYVGAARDTGAEIIIRVTSDCPLIDPEEADRVIVALESNAQNCDYAANVLDRTFPRGLDTEALFRDTLERLNRIGTSPSAREHVTIFVSQNPSLFITRSVRDTADNSDLRWTVDEPRDFEMVRRLYEELGLAHNDVPYRELVAFVRAHPEISSLNSAVQQKTVH